MADLPYPATKVFWLRWVINTNALQCENSKPRTAVTKVRDVFKSVALWSRSVEVVGMLWDEKGDTVGGEVLDVRPPFPP